jgi:type IV pilus assembly protein PilY1
VFGNLDAADFTATGLSQWSLLSPTQKTAAAGENLVNYLRGQTGYEDRGSNPANNRLYRFREATLGDALESQPFFISKPVFNYADKGYATYKTDQASRTGMVFMGANDGMLHAFYAKDQVVQTPPATCVVGGASYCGGEEAWAYIPKVVIPNMWRLADKNYSTQHRNYVNGSPIISDICTANCGVAATATWKTILVGGLNAGGRSYYALDITDPVTPTLLWEISSSTSGFENLGFSYGQPIITKKADGTWVVLVTSGYNNTSPGDGHGYLFVLDAVTGAKISEYDTGVGDTTTPSGLAKVSAWNDYQGIDNTAGYVYGGDLLGNLWRFDINSAPSLDPLSRNPLLFTTLLDSSSIAQPVTTAPTLGEIESQRFIFVGTGKYLETSDLTDTSKQTIYAIKDNNATTTLTNARTALVQQTMSMASADATARYGSNNPVDLSSPAIRGWYVDLASIIAPSTTPSFVGERVNIDMQLVQGTLIAATIVPSNTVCAPGGTGWLNFFNYETGGYVDSATQTVSHQYGSPIVGINVIFIEGKPIVETVTANKPTPEVDESVQIKGGGVGFQKKRVIWRELIQ